MTTPYTTEPGWQIIEPKDHSRFEPALSSDEIWNSSIQGWAEPTIRCFVSHCTYRRRIQPETKAVEKSGNRDISTAPKDGSEILIWREDSGWLLARWIAPCDFLNESELEKMELKDSEEPDWFIADFVSGGRLDGGAPTLWQPLPADPPPTKSAAELAFEELCLEKGLTGLSAVVKDRLKEFYLAGFNQGKKSE